MDQRLNKMYREFQQSKGEGSIYLISGRSPFTQSIQEELNLTNFRLPSLEAFYSNSDLMEHTVAFRAQMPLYATSDVLMCRVLPTTLRGSTREWYSCQKPPQIWYSHINRRHLRGQGPPPWERRHDERMEGEPKPRTSSTLIYRQGYLHIKSKGCCLSRGTCISYLTRMEQRKHKWF